MNRTVPNAPPLHILCNQKKPPFQENGFLLLSFILLGLNILYNTFYVIHKGRSPHGLSQIAINIFTVSSLLIRKDVLKKTDQLITQTEYSNDPITQKTFEKRIKQLNRIRMITIFVLSANTCLNAFYLYFIQALNNSLIAILLLRKGPIGSNQTNDFCKQWDTPLYQNNLGECNNNSVDDRVYANT